MVFCICYLLKDNTFILPKNSLFAAAAAAKLLQSCPTLSDPKDCSQPGSTVHRIFQARVLEWGAIAFSSLFANQLQTKTHNANVRVLFQSGPTYFIFYIKKKK